MTGSTWKCHNDLTTDISTSYTHFNFFVELWTTIAWEPGAAKVNKSYFSRLPALEQLYWESKYFYVYSRPTQLRM